MTPETPCPAPARLRELLAATLTEDEMASLHAHLDTCRDCRQTLLDLVAAPEFWDFAARCLKETGPTEEDGLRRAMAGLEGLPSAPTTQPNTGRTLPDDLLGPPERPGDLGRLGHYEVLDVLGRGGMGVVFRARDERLQRIVAIKVIAPHLAADEQVRARFIREARFTVEAGAAAAAGREHIVAVHSVEEWNGRPFLVMEYVAGPSLRRRMDVGLPLSFREVAELCRQAAVGLAAAHARGLIHRDIKPANLLLEPVAPAGGAEVYRLKVTDFGLARAADEAGLSQPITLAGTPQYMAPEQARGESVDRRADVYSLGVTLYEMATGRPAFARGSMSEVLARVAREEPPAPRAVNCAVPPGLEAIILRAIAKEPGERYDSAAFLAEDLARWLDGRPLRSRGWTWIRRLWRGARRHALNRTVAAMMLFALAVGGAAWIIPRGPDPEAQAAAAARWRAEQWELMQQELRAGHKIVVIPETGRPHRFRWARADAAEPEYRTSLAPDRTFYVESWKLGLMELLPDPLHDSYRISVEVRHEQAIAVSEHVGVYFLHGTQNTPDGLMHSFCNFSYNAVHDMRTWFPRTGRQNPAELRIEGDLDFDGVKTPGRSKEGRGFDSTVTFHVEPNPRKVWCRLTVEVTPEKVRARFEVLPEQPEAGPSPIRVLAGTGVRPGGWIEVSRANLLKTAEESWRRPPEMPGPPPSLPLRGGLGLYVRSGAASFRNVTIEPLGR